MELIKIAEKSDLFFSKLDKNIENRSIGKRMYMTVYLKFTIFVDGYMDDYEFGPSKGGFHAEDGAKKYGLPAVTFNAPGLKPHPLHKISGWQAVKTAINPYMSIFRDPLNALGVYDKRVVNYVNQDDVVGNYGVHFGKVVVTDDGEPPVERNDYLYPNKDQVRTVIARAVKILREGGTEKFRFEHSLDPFDAHFGREGNIAR